MSTHYDLIAIGAGSGGLSVVERAAEYGAKTAVIEVGELGGTCVNVGCVPKKIMWYGAGLAHALSDAEDYGFEVTRGKLDWTKLIAKRDNYIGNINDWYQDSFLAERNINLIRGFAHFIDDHTLEVDGKTFPVWHYVSKKTHTVVKVPLVDVAYDIMMKWREVKPCSSSTIARYLKTIAKMAGLTQKVQVVNRGLHKVEQVEKEKWEEIHFHQGRSGMVTRLIKQNVPPQIVAEITGMSVQNLANYYRTDDNDLLHQLNILENQS